MTALQLWIEQPDRRSVRKQRTWTTQLGQLDLTDIHQTFHLKSAEYTFFSSAPETFSKTGHILSHKTNPNKFKIKNHIKCLILFA